MSPIQFLENRRREKEVRRQLRIRDGRRRTEAFIASQKKQLRRYWDLATRAHRLADKESLRKLASLIADTRAQISLWERRLLYFDMMESIRNQVVAGAEFARAFEAMAQSVLAQANPADLARIRVETERAALAADGLESSLEDLQAVFDEGILSPGEERSPELEEIMKAIGGEAEAAGEPGTDPEIEATLRQIDAYLKREGA